MPHILYKDVNRTNDGKPPQTYAATRFMPRLTRIDGSAQFQLLSTLQVFLFPTTPKRRIFPSSFSRQHAEVLYDVVQAAYGTFGDQNRTHYRLLREKRGLSYLLLPICHQYRSDPPAPPLI